MASTNTMNKKLGKTLQRSLFNQKNIDTMLSPNRGQTLEGVDALPITPTPNSNQGLSPNSVHDFSCNDTQNGSPNTVETPVVTYRQKRRIESATRQYTGRTRGPSRALQPRRQRLKSPGFKPTATISPLFLRVVGHNAVHFIAECSNWVKHYCPLNARSWIKMDATAKQSLFDKIKGEWNLPVGPHVDRALTIQCSQLFRHWRFRLKELHFVGKTQQQALKNQPTEVDAIHWRWLVVDYWGNEKARAISAKNRANSGTPKLRSLNGSLSTARIFDSLGSAPIIQQVNGESTDEGGVQSTQVQQPDYIRLWEKTKKNKDGTWDSYANAKYEEFKKVHAEEVSKHGVENLTVEQAYAKVFHEGTGYIKGLGAGARYSKKNNSFAEQLNDQVTQRFEKIQQDSELREASLRDEIDTMKATTIQKEKEAKEREQLLKDEVSEMKDQLRKVLEAFKASQMVPS